MQRGSCLIKLVDETCETTPQRHTHRYVRVDDIRALRRHCGMRAMRGERGVRMALWVSLTLAVTLAMGALPVHAERNQWSNLFRFYVKYEEFLQTGGRISSHNDLRGYVLLTLDEPRDQVLVGARDTLMRLSLGDLGPLEVEEWRTPPSQHTICSAIRKSESCHNFIRVLLVQRGEVFACGTSGYQPSCTRRLANQLTNVTESYTGRGICPFAPQLNTTALMTEDGELYVATYNDQQGIDPSISRLLQNTLRTAKKNSMWLNEPNFVSSYEIGNFVYFFFRETAVEHINCGKKVFSRAARVCKSDRGVLLKKGLFTSFHKARLNCSRPGLFPSYFHELQSTHFNADEGKLYAVFTTGPNDIAGSAVCVYDMSSIEKAFEGDFKYQKNSKSLWLPRHNLLNKTKVCVEGSERDWMVSSEHVVGAQFQLMDKAVQPLTEWPLIIREHDRWTHVAVDHVTTQYGDADVIFLATDDGRLHKIMHLHPSSSQPPPSSASSSSSSDSGAVTCLVEEVELVPKERAGPVLDMTFSAAKGALYIATGGNILKVPVQRCHRFKDRRSCLGSGDPYCGWHKTRQACTPSPRDGSGRRNARQAEDWEQRAPSCHDLSLQGLKNLFAKEDQGGANVEIDPDTLSMAFGSLQNEVLEIKNAMQNMERVINRAPHETIDEQLPNVESQSQGQNQNGGQGQDQGQEGQDEDQSQGQGQGGGEGQDEGEGQEGQEQSQGQGQSSEKDEGDIELEADSGEGQDEGEGQEGQEQSQGQGQSSEKDEGDIELEADPCNTLQYHVLDEAWRLTRNTEQNPLMCDKDVFDPSKWYRFLAAGHDVSIVTNRISRHRCQTHVPMWADLHSYSLPEVAHQKTVHICANRRRNMCGQNGHITVRNCGHFWLYKINSSFTCHSALCVRLMQHYRRLPE